MQYPVVDEIFMERMTWEEIREAIERGKRRVVVMVGAMEQHGPHLPIGTDTYLGYALGELVARELGDALVAPVINLGYSVGHMCFPGTVSITPETLAAVVRDVCRALAQHGFEEVVLFASHGGNHRILGQVLAELQAELADKVSIQASTSMDAWARWYREYSLSQGRDPARVGVHAGQGETSMMLAARPELVHMDRAVEGFLGDASIRWRSQVPPPMNTMSPTGILGDPRGSTSEFGERMLKAKARLVADLVRQGKLSQWEGAQGSV